MRVIMSGDWHCFLENLDRCQIIVDQILSLKPDFVVHLGDIVGSANGPATLIDQRVTNFLVESVRRIREQCQGVYFLRGNHDSVTIHDGSPSCATLIEALGADVVADHGWKVAKLGPHVRLFLVPYLRDPESQRKEFAAAAQEATKYPSSDFGILVFHNEVEGCQQSTYTKGKGLIRPYLSAETYNICVGGHIHLPQLLVPKGGKGTPIYFAGSPFCQTWSEVNELKSIFCLDIDEKTLKHCVTLVPSRVPGWYDPSKKDFFSPIDWTGTRVRISVPIENDVPKELASARKICEKHYPGANLHLVPEFVAPQAVPTSIDTTKNDEGLLRDYLEKLVLPAGVTVDQVIAYLQTYLKSIGVFGVQGLKFGEVTAKEVLCFKDIKLNLDQKGLTLITGKNLDWNPDESVSNGSGKSSVTALPFLALFGRTFKGQTFDGWARQESTLPALVTQSLEIPDGRSLRIERGRRPGRLRIYLDGSEISMGTAEATQMRIERLTNLTWSVLTNAVYIGQREIGSVFGTEKDRKELFSRLLGLDRFLEAQEKIRKVLSRCRNNVEDTEGEIRSLDSALEETVRGLTEIQETLTTTPEVDSKKVSETEKAVAEEEASIRRNALMNKTLEPTMEKNQQEFESYLSKATESETKIETLKEQYDASAKVSGRCYVCGGKVSVETLEKYQEEIKSKIACEEVTLERYEGLQNENRTTRRTLIEKIQANNFQSDKMRRTLTALNSSLTVLKEQADARRRLETILSSKMSRGAELKQKRSVHERANLAWLEEVQFLETCVKVVGRDGLPAYLCSVVAPALNSAASKYSEIFSEGEIGIQFEISGGDIDVRVCNLHGGKSIKDQSAGEMRLAGLITALAFRDALVPHNLLVMDEPTEGLDASNARAFAQGLSSVIERFKHVIVISHSPYVLSELEPDRHWEVTKKDGISTLRELPV